MHTKVELVAAQHIPNIQLSNIFFLMCFFPECKPSKIMYFDFGSRYILDEGKWQELPDLPKRLNKELYEVTNDQQWHSDII